MEMIRIWSRAQTGDRTAAHLLYDALRELVLGSRTARRLGPHDLEDLVQDVCVSVMSQLRGLSFPANLGAFVGFRAQSKSRAIVRRRGRLGTQEECASARVEDSAASAPWRQLSDAEDCKALRYCIGILPHEQSECVRRRYQRGDTVRQIAESVGVTHVTIYKRLEAARKSLFACLKSKGVTA